VGLRGFERRLESLVEGTFARVFKSGLTPLEIGQRIVREIDANQTVATDGALSVPNHYWVYVSSADHGRFAEVETQLTNELIEAARTHIADEGYRLLGPVSATLVEAPEYPEGTLQVQAQWREGAVRQGAATIVLSSGERFAVSPPFTVGRLPGLSLVLGDENVSRNHAVIEMSGHGWIVRDLQSTNGTKVNGAPVAVSPIRNGDSIVFGATQATFESH